jgi:hypothetical protein
MTVRLRLALIAALVLLAPTLASVQVWPSEIRRKFIDECLTSCGANTKLTSVQRAECPPFCEWMVKGSQSSLSADDYTALQEANAVKNPSPLRGATRRCPQPAASASSAKA